MSDRCDKPLPYIHEETSAYWEGTKRHELRVRKCRVCGRHHFYPRSFCPTCLSSDLEWTKASGRGTIYSYTICWRPAPGFEEDVPYNLALVELNVGVRMMSTIVECPLDEIAIGMEVEVVFDDITAEVTLPRFKPRKL